MHYQVKSNIYYIYKKWGTFIYIIISSYENVYKMTVLSSSGHGSNEWPRKLVKELTKIT